MKWLSFVKLFIKETLKILKLFYKLKIKKNVLLFFNWDLFQKYLDGNIKTKYSK